MTLLIKLVLGLIAVVGLTLTGSLVALAEVANPPKVIVISLDSGNPQTLREFWQQGVLKTDAGLGQIAQRGVFARRNITITPSVTAPGHIAIATGSTAARNDITANTFHLVRSAINRAVSGFGAPIGGYDLGATTPAPTVNPTAQPLWVRLRAAGRRVVTATWPGGDGVTVTEPTSGATIQSADTRTVDYTIPFGSFAGVGGRGFELTRSNFANAPQETVDQLRAAGRTSFSPVLQTTAPLETFTTQGITFTIQLAALDTTNDNQTNYDTVVIWNQTQGIQPGPFTAPSTGPAYIRVSDRRSSPFFLEGTSGRAGTSYYVTLLDPQLSTVRLVRYSANSIPRNGSPAVLANVDDINNNVGFWRPQADFRFPERINAGLANFPDLELEAVYEDQVRSFVEYQTNIGLRAIRQNPGADLVMIYIEQPDGSGHQFTLTDRRQATNFTDPNSIGSNQDQDKIARYNQYRAVSYQVADAAVQRIIQEVGTTTNGTPRSNIFVVSDHGMAPFHTAVSINNLLQNAGLDSSVVRAYTTGPAVNLYINLQGRESGGTVSPSEYVNIQQRIRAALNGAVDSNPTFNRGLGRDKRIFDLIELRPGTSGLGQSPLIGQDSGDVFAILKLGYNFDGTQTPVVLRQGDPFSATPVLSVSNFYGAHGYDPMLPEMSAIFLAAGPNIRRAAFLPRVRNIDVAPTVMQILGVAPASTVEGRAITQILR